MTSVFIPSDLEGLVRTHGDAAKNQIVIDAGKTLAIRFQPKGRYLRSFVSQDSLFIDIMMNVGIIFYAAQQTQDASLLKVATEHCLTTRRYLVRGDSSTSHEGLFDVKTGEFLKQTTHQGAQRFDLGARTNLGYLRV
jgi:unsaturated chondroitin disaccharide hydrolase